MKAIAAIFALVVLAYVVGKLSDTTQQPGAAQQSYVASTAAQDVWRGSAAPRPPFAEVDTYCRLLGRPPHCVTPLMREWGSIFGSARRCGVPEARTQPMQDRVQALYVALNLPPAQGTAALEIMFMTGQDAAQPGGGREFGIACDALVNRMEVFERALGLRPLLR